MIAILQWSTLAVCVVVAAARVPSAVRGQNRSLFYIFALMALAILLSIEGPYLAIDQAMGGVNAANLLLRFVIFAAIYFVGIRITKGFDAADGYRLITGRIGMSVLGLVSLVVVAVFLMMDTAGSSAGLSALSAADGPNEVLVEYYAAAGRAYPAYVALVLLPAMCRACRSTLPRLVRLAALLLAIGSVAIGLSLLFPLIPPELGSIQFVINYTAVLCFVVGLALIWAARVRYGGKMATRRTSTEK
ncbi:hypothetical protein [Arthrobacter sp. HMWF013]|uniref:hypothetical protein n=1 Tax=Arthrobacter sp. HMWF013 TaxID=2056849 RepID=UPI000D36EAB9|nr:hypothetical protein [Arthrobacter sp. HMWF013]PTT67142.1 hypothetical protein DBR22_09520 [Arthrobacter sp. HMWF013]